MFVKGLVVGNSVESLLFSFVNGYYHLNTGAESPFFYEKLKTGIFGTMKKQEAWNKLQLYMSLMGKSLSYKNISKIDIDDGICRVVGDMRVENYKFEQCYVFNTLGITFSNEIKRTQGKEYRVVDDLEVRNLSKNTKEIADIETDSNLATRVIFYTSDRIDGANYITDCVTESYLTQDQLLEFDYSDTMVKFKVQKLLLQAGYPGRVIGKLKSGKNKYYKPELTHKRRIIVEQDKTLYKNSKSVRFVKSSVEQIINEKAAQR